MEGPLDLQEPNALAATASSAVTPTAVADVAAASAASSQSSQQSSSLTAEQRAQIAENKAQAEARRAARMPTPATTPSKSMSDPAASSPDFPPPSPHSKEPLAPALATAVEATTAEGGAAPISHQLGDKVMGDGSALQPSGEVSAEDTHSDMSESGAAAPSDSAAPASSTAPDPSDAAAAAASATPTRPQRSSARSSAAEQPPLHNLPPPAGHSEPDGVLPQIYDQDAEAGLQRNCALLGLTRVQSGLNGGNAGFSVTVDQPRASDALLGYMFGFFITVAQWHAIRTGGAEAEALVKSNPEMQRQVEMAQSGVWWCTTAEAVSDSNEEYLLLVSPQCPMGLINDGRTEHAANVETRGATRCTQSADGLLDYWVIPVHATTALAAGDELFLDYGWTPADWKHRVKVPRVIVKADDAAQQAASAAALTPSTSVMTISGGPSQEKPSNTGSSSSNSSGGSGSGSGSPPIDLAPSSILQWVRLVSSNLVPESCPHFHGGVPGLLLTDTCLPTYQRPFCITWLVDEQLSRRREQDVALAPLAQATPGLPFWLWTSPGDNECGPRSMLLTDTAKHDDDFQIDDLVNGMQQLTRNPITGGVTPGSPSAAAELAFLADYRVRLARWLSGKDNANSSAEAAADSQRKRTIENIRKPKTAIDVEEFIVHASHAHRAVIQIARVDSRLDDWPSDHNLPSGVLLVAPLLRAFPDKTRQLLQCSVDQVPPFPYTSAQSEDRHITLLHFNNAEPGRESSMLGHLEPLAGAPSLLCQLANHPLFTGHAAIMYPFVAVPQPQQWLMPFYQGKIGFSLATLVRGLVPVDDPAGVDSSSTSTLIAFLRCGTIIRFMVPGQTEEQQGVVLAVYIIQSPSHALALRDALAARVEATKLQQLLPATAPKTVLAVWPLVKKAGDDQQPGGCWSGVSRAAESLILNLYVGDVIGVVSPTFAFPASSSAPTRKIATKKMVLSGKSGVHFNYAKASVPGPMMSDTVIAKVTEAGAFMLLESWFAGEVEKEQQRARNEFGEMEFLPWVQAEATKPFDIEAAAGMRAILRNPPPVICAAAKLPSSNTSQFGSESQAAAARNNASSAESKGRNGSATPSKASDAASPNAAAAAAPAAAAAGDSAAAAAPAAAAAGDSATDAAKAAAPPDSDRSRPHLPRRSAAAKAPKAVTVTPPKKKTPAAAQVVAVEAPALDAAKILKALGSFTAPERDAPLASWLIQLRQLAGKSATQLNKMKPTDWNKIWDDMRIADPALARWLEEHFHIMSPEEICTTLETQGWRRVRGYGSKIKEAVVWSQHRGVRPTAEQHEDVKSFATALREAAQQLTAEAVAAAAAPAASSSKSKRTSTSAANEEQQGPAKREKKANGKATRVSAAEPAVSTAAAAAASSPAAEPNRRQARAEGRHQQQQPVFAHAPTLAAGPATISMDLRMRQIEQEAAARIAAMEKVMAAQQAKMAEMIETAAKKAATIQLLPTTTSTASATPAAAAAAAFTTPPSINSRKRSSHLAFSNAVHVEGDAAPAAASQTAASVSGPSPSFSPPPALNAAAAADSESEARVKRENRSQIAALESKLELLQGMERQAQTMQAAAIPQPQTQGLASLPLQLSPQSNTQMQPYVSASQQQQQLVLQQQQPPQHLQQQQQQPQQQLISAQSLQLQPYPPPQLQQASAQSAHGQLQPYLASPNLSAFNVSPQRGVPPSALMALQMQMAMQSQHQQTQLALHQQQLLSRSHDEAQQRQAQLALQQQQQLAQSQQVHANMFSQFMHHTGMFGEQG